MSKVPIEALFRNLKVSDDCTICLEPIQIDKKAFLESCGHPFCYNCILTWSKDKHLCPLCKQFNKNIIHNVTSETEYEMTEIQLASGFSLSDADLHLEPPVLLEPIFPDTSFFYHNTGPSASAPISVRQGLYTGILVPRIAPTGNTNLSSPEHYRENPESFDRLKIWVSRELTVVNSVAVERFDEQAVYNEIVELLQTHSINSDIFRERILEYLREDCDVFIRELNQFAISHLNLYQYDLRTEFSTPVMAHMQPGTYFGRFGPVTHTHPHNN